VVMVVAPPQTAKTSWMATVVVSAPGAVVATTTKSDLLEASAPARAERGCPVIVFNPDRISGIDSNLSWSPLEGCTDPRVATQRAAYLVSTTVNGVSEGDFWENQSARVLRALLLAAAVGGMDMRAVYRWISDPGDIQALTILRDHPELPQSWAEDLNAIQMNTPERTRGSIYTTLYLAVAWMQDERIAELCCPAPGTPSFDVAEFLRSRATLYLLGSEKMGGNTTPLVTAFTGALFEAAKQIAMDEPGRRLDPPLTLALDEAALICPVPLDRWTSDAGGRGIPLIFAVQALSQLKQRWGHNGAATIVSNSNVKVIFGGLTVADELDDLAELAGQYPTVERSVQDARAQAKRTGSGKTVTRAKALRSVIRPYELRMLPSLHAFVLSRNAPPVIVRIRPWWRDRVATRAKVRYERGLVRRARVAITVPRPRVPLDRLLAWPRGGTR
jgi:type IV secretion system protein VirD4